MVHRAKENVHSNREFPKMREETEIPNLIAKKISGIIVDLLRERDIPERVKSEVLNFKTEDIIGLQKRLRNLTSKVMKLNMDEDVFQDLFLIYCYNYISASPHVLYKLGTETKNSIDLSEEAEEKEELRKWYDSSAEKGALVAFKYMSENNGDSLTVHGVMNEKATVSLTNLVAELEQAAQIRADGIILNLFETSSEDAYEMMARNHNDIMDAKRPLTGEDVCRKMRNMEGFSKLLSSSIEQPLRKRE